MENVSLAVLIPAFSTIEKNSHTTVGERRFALRLERFLDDSCFCWYDIPVGQHRRYPDFIVLSPEKGLLFLEVKDWKISSLKRITPTEVTLQTQEGLKRVSNPLEQVRHCAYSVIDSLKKDRHLQQKQNSFHKGKLCFPYGYGVVLPFITRKQLNDALVSNPNVLPPKLVVCSDEMTENTHPNAFQKRLWDMFHYQFGSGISPSLIDRIRWHLYPEIRINQSIQDDLFDYDSTIHCAPDVVKIMDMNQEVLARSLGDGHRVIHGVAGSGKTLVLGFRSLYLAESLVKPILITCYNVTLAARLKAFVEDKNLSDKVHVYNFHSWCYEVLAKNKLIDINEQVPNEYDDYPNLILEHLESGTLKLGQYGAILIDEGHDLEADWFRVLVKMLDPEIGCLLLLYDDAQSIYKKKSALDFSLSSVGIQAQGRTTILKLNYRNTKEILDYAYRFAHQYFEHHPKQDIPIVKPESAGVHGPKPVIKAFDSLFGEVENIVRYISKWLKAGQSVKDIAILYPDFESGKAMHSQLKKYGIAHLWCANTKFKKQYSPFVDKLTLVPLQSSKGLEFQTVIVMNSSFTRLEQSIDEVIKLLYVSFTRATQHLLITYHQKNALSKALLDAEVC
ncbi:3'-5' exonuclease [Vibrio parahaemolyticus]|uniref:3'-5' exonuclease n=1 Tax=Vibrio parahaemolyticus TaxID=670 RepID=UPI001D15E712|nr:3'-5' exonuclease [Vibrio parahaemolyticus]MCC3796919.1 NERD domain-containing protein [Vibrio parahaemolyticus]MCC3811604.1 NERD domain-containing protein [Vibrio parahaemolyticus]MCR9727866.1 NERD domain-containing protein [Vibrio parahaemolyticus]MCR9750285.1 NERD domain-containing protein [Vibrio parahaemolyticus]MCR9783991.1 NERD domain-containing protein [Vibrio parahaemolyticus]